MTSKTYLQIQILKMMLNSMIMTHWIKLKANRSKRPTK
jgi:hypothetical protein